MTSAQQPEQQDQRITQAEEAAALALALFLASTAAVEATLLPQDLVNRLVNLGLSAKAVRAAGRIALEPALTGRGRWGSPRRVEGRSTLPRELQQAPAKTSFSLHPVLAQSNAGSTSSTVRDIKADEPVMRAHYILNAAKRLTEAEVLGVFEPAERREVTYMDQQRAAGLNRARAAANLDRVAAEAQPSGGWLRWVATMDERTTADCAALNGRLFTRNNLPQGQIPGAVHPRCRCTAVPAIEPGGAVPTVTAA